MQDEGKYFKVLSWLLQYPDDTYLGAVPEIKSVVEAMRPGPCKAAIKAFMAYLEAGTGLQLQERYTALFDMSPSTTMNMTYHLWGDGEKRARLLTGLQQEYARAGLEKSTTELPDHLPLILEFMAVVPQARQFETIKKSLAGIDKLVDHLQPVAASYAALLAPLSAMLKEQEQKRTAATAE